MKRETKTNNRKKISVKEKVVLAKQELYEINKSLKKISDIVSTLPEDMEIDYLMDRKSKIEGFLKSALNINISEGEDGLVADIETDKGEDVNVDEGQDDRESGDDYLDLGEGEDGDEGAEDVVNMEKEMKRMEFRSKNLKRKIELAKRKKSGK